MDIPRVVQYIKKSRVINSFCLVNFVFQGCSEDSKVVLIITQS